MEYLIFNHLTTIILACILIYYGIFWYEEEECIEHIAHKKNNDPFFVPRLYLIKVRRNYLFREPKEYLVIKESSGYEYGRKKL